MLLFFKKILSLSEIRKRFLLIFIDGIAVAISLIMAISLRFGFSGFLYYDIFWFIFISPFIAVGILYFTKIYRTNIPFMGFRAIWLIIKSITLYSAIFALFVLFFENLDNIPLGVIFFHWILLMLVIVGLRMIIRLIILDIFSSTKENIKKVLIYGAGSAGRQLSIALKESPEYNPIAFIDDSKDLQGGLINDFYVFSREDLMNLIEKYNITQVLLAIPSISRSHRKEIINFLEPFPVSVLALPGVSELAQGKISVEDISEPSIFDLLGREKVTPNNNLDLKTIEDKVVMVTGAGGSIGSELCRQILEINPKTLILFEMSEIALFEIQNDLIKQNINGIEIYSILGNVCNKIRLQSIFKQFNIDIIYHAAAYKHVPIVELNGFEGINNNIFGTLLCAQIAIEHKVKTFVLVSSDKAVRPSNIMGATKRVSELILQAFSNIQNDTKFTMVRFGNVLGSSGSVIPFFLRQIRNGGPVTVTDENVIRYFMTISEAVGLLLQAGEMAKGGDVFLLDMGEPIRINDLAKKMIHLSGLEIKNQENPNGDIEIKYTGLRPGEKLYEELLIGKESISTDNPLIMRAKEEMIEWNALKVHLDELYEASDKNNIEKCRKILQQIVPGYRPKVNNPKNYYKL